MDKEEKPIKYEEWEVPGRLKRRDLIGGIRLFIAHRMPGGTLEATFWIEGHPEIINLVKARTRTNLFRGIRTLLSDIKDPKVREVRERLGGYPKDALKPKKFMLYRSSNGEKGKKELKRCGHRKYEPDVAFYERNKW
jgi:hypothetical protein